MSLGLLIAPAVGVGVWILRPITFTARITLQVDSSQKYFLYPIQEGRGDFNTYQRGQIALVKSRFVLNAALRDPKVEKLAIVQEQEDPVAWMEKEVQADFSIAPEILRISMTGEDSKALPIIVDAVRNAYLNEIVNKEKNVREKRLKELTDRFARYDADLKQKRDTLKTLAQRTGGKDNKVLAITQENYAKHLRDLQSKLLERQSEISTAKMELAARMVSEEPNAKIRIPDRVVDEKIKLDPVVIGWQKEATQHELDIAAFKERSPAPEKELGYKKAVQALDAANAALAKRREELRPIILKQLREKILDDQLVMAAQLENRVSYLTDVKKVLEEQIALCTKDVNAFKLDVVGLEFLQDEIALLETVNKDFTRQMQALEIEIAAPSRVSPLDREVIMVPTQTPSSRLRLAVGSGLGAFVAVLFGISFLEFRRRRVSHADEVVQGLRIKLMGSLPLVPKRALLGRASAARNMEWQSRLTESVDSIRTALLNAARFEGLRRVMVTSAVGGEGKTLLSCHLAVSLARAGCKTLLIDGDLRRPSVHKLFNLPVAGGLSELLRGEAEPADVTNCGPVGLHVITAGQSDSQAIQLLSRDRIGEMLHQLGADYEFVVVDSAPVLPVADAQLIGQHVDGVVLSVMRDVSRLPTVYAACERLNLLRIRILGAVVNGMQGDYYQSSSYCSAPVPAEAARTREQQASV